MYIKRGSLHSRATVFVTQTHTQKMKIALALHKSLKDFLVKLGCWLVALLRSTSVTHLIWIRWTTETHRSTEAEGICSQCGSIGRRQTNPTASQIFAHAKSRPELQHARLKTAPCLALGLCPVPKIVQRKDANISSANRGEIQRTVLQKSPRGTSGLGRARNHLNKALIKRKPCWANRVL